LYPHLPPTPGLQKITWSNESFKKGTPPFLNREGRTVSFLDTSNDYMKLNQVGFFENISKRKASSCTPISPPLLDFKKSLGPMSRLKRDPPPLLK